jgi:hypothetical protein
VELSAATGDRGTKTHAFCPDEGSCLQKVTDSREFGQTWVTRSVKTAKKSWLKLGVRSICPPLGAWIGDASLAQERGGEVILALWCRRVIGGPSSAPTMATQYILVFLAELAGYCPFCIFSWEAMTVAPAGVTWYSPYSIVKIAVPKTRTFVSLSFDAGSQKSPIFW